MSELAYRSEEHPLGAMRRTHSVDRGAVRRNTAWSIVAALAGGAAFGLLSREERLIRFVAFAGVQIACAFVAYAVRLSSTPRVSVRERAIELGEGGRAIPFATIQRIEERNRALVRLYLESGERVRLSWVGDPAALLATLRAMNARLNA